ncbi:MAG: porin family protein [Xanthobacteraceae bacterium]|nr:porin family protein [Xanthobacteraceae bacterium]
MWWRRISWIERLLLGAVLASVAMADAPAADMGVPFLAPGPVPVDIWTGLYGGINFGWAASNNALGSTATDTGPAGLGAMVAARAIPVTMRGIHGGFIGGTQIGFNWEFSPAWIAGIETDFDWLANSDAISVFPYAGSLAFPALTTTFVRGLDTLGTVRARFGVLVAPMMLAYAAGGFAYGETRLGTTFICPQCVSPAAISSTSSSIAAGWTLGAGLEWQFAPRWSVKGEYLWVDLGSRSETLRYAYPPFDSALTSSVNQRYGIVRTGLTYRFW